MDLTGINWTKSSRSSGSNACVEIGVWRKAERSMANGACVEVAIGVAENRAA